jgi:endonuclease/exonuclease/phosphatase (EEP) superfamily protein YafD
MQFNMQFGQKWDETNPDGAPIDLKGSLAEIRRHKADIILLQEVEHASAEGTKSQLAPNYALLSEALAGEYHGILAMPRPDPRELPFGIGLAIFSRQPLEQVMRVDLPSPPVHFDFFGKDMTPTDRVLLGAVTQAGGIPLHVFTTHLLAFFMLKSSSSEHPEQRRIVADLMKQTEGAALIGGDFNVSRHRELVEQMTEAGCTTVQTDQITWRRRPYVLDHIFFNNKLRCVGHSVVPTMASDHHILLANFETS